VIREPHPSSPSPSLRSRLQHQRRWARLFTTLLVLTVIAALFLVIALAAAWPDLDAIRAARDARVWPTVPGEIVEAHVDRSRVDRPWRTNWFSETERDLGYERHLPRLRYRYEVDDSTYSGFRISYHPRHSWPRGEAHAFVDAFPVGTRVDVHVEPGHPSHASLELPLDRTARWKIPAAGFLCVVALGFGTRRAYARWRAAAGR